MPFERPHPTRRTWAPVRRFPPGSIDSVRQAGRSGCARGSKFPVLERVAVRSVRPGLLDRLHGNDPTLPAELLLKHQNRIPLDWDGAWRLDTGAPPARAEVRDVAVRFAAPIPVRPVRLIAEGVGLSRAGVERLLADGKLVSAIRLSGRTAADFTFTLKP
ncbi:DUF1062 domain-containing protein [Streptomyces sp. PLK6-54]|uniref:DUF1062 domain-containing protein n=1 Tax=Actinacidiphila acidipaludis TaxID=2873382 RepID=A0ABS7QCL1_9ACTN|nr:DUF1062 domain-containing protein [Streptomyces acidipaludis]